MPQLPPEVIAKIQQMLDEGTHSYSAIARTLSLGNKMVARIAHNIELFNAPYPPSCVVKGRPRALTAAQEDFILKYLNDRPTAHLGEVTSTVNDQFDVRVHETTVGRVLKRRCWSRKVSKRVSSEAKS